MKRGKVKTKYTRENDKNSPFMFGVGSKWPSNIPLSLFGICQTFNKAALYHTPWVQPFS